MKYVIIIASFYIFSCKNETQKQQERYEDSMMIQINKNQKIIDSLIDAVDKEIIKKNYIIIKHNDSIIKKRFKNYK